MKQLRIIGIVISLLVFSLSITQVASADPMPPSTGCLSIVGYYTTQDIGNSYFGNFWDDDTVHIVTDMPVNFRVTNSYGLVFNHNGVTNINYNIPRSSQYVFAIVPVGGVLTHMVITCTPTPIDAGCVDTDYALDPGGVSVDYTYYAGDHIHVGATGPVRVRVTGPVSGNFPGVTTWNFIVPVTGVYNFDVIANPQAGITGLLRCTVPR